MSQSTTLRSPLEGDMLVGGVEKRGSPEDGKKRGKRGTGCKPINNKKLSQQIERQQGRRKG